MGCSQSVSVAQVEYSNMPKEPKLKGKSSSTYSSLELQQSAAGVYVCGPRSKMKLQVSNDEDFLSHHLQNQLCLSPYANAQKIRARQIIEHYMFHDLSHPKIAGELSTSKLTEFAIKAWFQRTFIECLKKAQDLYFHKKVSYEAMRERLAEQYIFQIYKMGEFVNSGFGRFGDGKRRVEVPLSLILLNSDSALYPLLSRLQLKYPLVQETQSITYPDIKPMSQNINLLKLINSKCYSDPKNLNIQTTYDDLKFLIDQANNVFSDFKSDMIELLGKQALTDCKVKRSLMSSQKASYNASSIRRVFIKWSETLIERIPDIYSLQEFLEFIKSKKHMADQFIFKSIVSKTTHQKVIEYLSLLLDSIKYKVGTSEPRQEFGLFLYDLLRCKTTRKTGQEIATLLQTLQKTTATASGKRLEVVRIKNRFKSATRDILINFRYGQFLIGQAQLCIDSPHDSPEIAKQIKFRHYLYELERGLFGPTFELIMQYQDSSRKDITVYLEAEGQVKARTFKNNENLIKKAGRLCPQKHEMIAIKGNIFKGEKIIEILQNVEESFYCDFCFQNSNYAKQYHYCYYCSLFYCLKCLNVYKSTDFSKVQLSCTQQGLLTPISELQDISRYCKQHKAMILVAYKNGRPACRMFLDQIIYLLSTYLFQGRSKPNVFIVNVSDSKFSSFMKKYQITRLPTTLLFSENEEAQLTLVGSTFHDIEGFFQVQNRIKSNLPKGIKIKCNICSQTMSQDKEITELEKDKKCQICMDANKIQNFGDIFKSLKLMQKKFYCVNGHVKCQYCSYLNSNKPSYFRDHTGRSYLSSKLPTPVSCSKGHIFEIMKQPPSFSCLKCEQKIEAISEQEVGFCPSCKVFLCCQCLQAESQNFKEKDIKEMMKRIEIVSHCVQDLAQQSWPCGCGKLFLKVYQTRKKDIYNKDNSLLKSIKLHYQQKKWACFVCQTEISNLKLHLACFYCSFAQKIYGQISHIQICINCGMKSGLIGRTLPQKTIQSQTRLQCKKGHKIIKTSIGKQDSLFSCIECRRQFYGYSERYSCLSCQLNWCLGCSRQISNDPKIETTSKKCLKGHSFKLQMVGSSLGFCKECCIHIKGSHFECSFGCRQFLCLGCSNRQ